MTYDVLWSRQARRAIHEDLPEAVAAACLEFILGPLAENPHRVGHALRSELTGLHSARRGDFRIIYRIEDERVVVYIVTVRHRRDAYRS